MSIVAMNWAWDVRLEYLGERDNKAGRRLLLVALGDNANEEGVCWPAISTLARRCESSTKSVRRWLKEFTEHQLISIRPRRTTDGQTSNLYLLNLARKVAEKPQAPLDSVSGGEGDTESTPPGTPSPGPRTPGDQGPRTPGVPLTVIEPPTPSPSDAGDVFERAAGLDDLGRPLESDPALAPRQQPMTYDWQPDAAQLAMACQRRGLPVDTWPDRADLADFTAHFAEQPTRRLTQAGWHERLAKWIAENRRRTAPAQNTAGGTRHAQPAAAHRGLDRQAERQRIAEQLANPGDTSWADGWWPEDDIDAAQGPDAGAGQPGVHPAGGDFPENLGERVPECGPAEPGAPGAGPGAGPVAGAAHPGGGGAGHERVEARGEYLAADDPGPGEPAGADSGGLRHAGGW